MNPDHSKRRRRIGLGSGRRANAFRLSAPDEPTTLVEVFEYVARVPSTGLTRLTTSATVAGSPFLPTKCCSACATSPLVCIRWACRRGDRVAILSESRPEWTLTDAVVCLPAAIDVPIYPTLTPPQVRYILKDSGARVLVVQNEEKFLQIREMLAECPAIEHVIFFEKPASRATTTAAVSLAELEKRGATLARQQPDLIDRPGPSISPRRSGDDHLHLRHNRRTQGRDAHALEPGFKSDRFVRSSFV